MSLYHSSIAFLILALPLLQSLPSGSSPTRGFTLDLIHRDYSPSSPFYDPTETRSDRMRRDLLRSKTRAKHLETAPNRPVTDIGRSVWSYLVNISIGTPRVSFLGVVDTGSSLVWTQCKPCSPCFSQPGPIFDPLKSSTYKPVSCNSLSCMFPFKCGQHGLCKYKLDYEDGTFSIGTLAKETITLSESTSFDKIVIGCGNKNNITSQDGFSGIVGLGRGGLSLLSQIEDDIDGRFAYCLVSYSSIDESSPLGKLYFGEDAAVIGHPGVVSTPLIKKKSGFFYLHLEGISVSNTRVVECDDTSSVLSPNTSGNIIIDSGSAPTYLPRACYAQLESEIANQVKLERVPDPKKMLSLCYRTARAEIESPRVTIHFRGGNVELGNSNVFVMVDENVGCLGFVPQQHSLSVYGSIAQGDFLVGYDVKNNMLSFKHTDCSLKDQV